VIKPSEIHIKPLIRVKVVTFYLFQIKSKFFFRKGRKFENLNKKGEKV